MTHTYFASREVGPYTPVGIRLTQSGDSIIETSVGRVLACPPSLNVPLGRPLIFWVSQSDSRVVGYQLAGHRNVEFAS